MSGSGGIHYLHLELIIIKQCLSLFCAAKKKKVQTA